MTSPSARLVTVDEPESELVPAFLFDLDGTLVDSVYQHVLAWREALERAGMVRHAKPDPDLFLAAARGLGVPLERSVVADLLSHLDEVGVRVP